MSKLTVDQKNIKAFLSGIRENKFIIPDYQRPYSWNREKVETLWEDIVDAYEKKTGDEKQAKENYFLGTIVSYNKKGNMHIIDGQQRITTLTLLLRAFYEKVVTFQEGEVQRLRDSIESCLWKQDAITGKKDAENIHVESRVATDSKCATLADIIKYGTQSKAFTTYRTESSKRKMSEAQKNKYYDNYQYFIEKSNKFAEEKPMRWKNLCLFVLERCIILPIKCDDEEIALTIFQTLNDRGLPLSNADIFKARIYQAKASQEEKDAFIESWKELGEICEEAGMTLDDVFRYYSHILRAEANDKSKEIGLRKFYSVNRYAKLKQASIMDDLIELAKFWSYVNADNDRNIGYEISTNTKKWFRCLKRYPNEYWKYIASVFYYYNKKEKKFEELMEDCAKQLIQFLFLKFIDQPTVNAIKDSVFEGCVRIKNRTSPIFDKVRIDDFKKRVSQPPGRLLSGLLLLHAYLNKKQDGIIEGLLHIEHILPRKWQDANYNGWNEKDADEFLEKFGNKVICEDKINIQAGNGYFKKKKERFYVKSTIANVLQLVEQYPKDDWGKEEITSRETEVAATLKEFFKPLLEERKTDQAN